MEYRYRVRDEEHTVRVIERPEGFEVIVGERHYSVQAHEVDSSTLDLWVNGQFMRARHAEQATDRWLALNGEVFQATRLVKRRKPRQEGSGMDTLAATMPGQIVSVHVAAGETVEQGQLLLLMEAMKMELRVAAPHAGTVARLLVSPGDAVERGQTLVEMGPQGG